jgi:hypothetical protein
MRKTSRAGPLRACIESREMGTFPGYPGLFGLPEDLGIIDRTCLCRFSGIESPWDGTPEAVVRRRFAAFRQSHEMKETRRWPAQGRMRHSVHAVGRRR